MGIARINPIAPQSHPQNNSDVVTARAFKWTRRPTIAGIRPFNPTKQRGKVWHQSQQSRNATQQKWVFQMNRKEKPPAQEHQDDGNKGVAGHETSEHRTDFIERAPDTLLMFIRE